MGEVYEAEDLTLHRRVALKAIRPDQRLSQVVRERFQREARLLSRLDHPGICRIHDLFDFDGRDFLVLELIEGRTLQKMRGKLDGRNRLDIALQIARVLEAAHAEDIVHRDLKPENIMLTNEGQVKVLDFGLARDLAYSPTGTIVDPEPTVPSDPGQTIEMVMNLSQGGAIMGTPAYLSPEQANGKTAKPPSDMYSFGLVLQHLFTGQRSYDDSDTVEEILAQARAASTRPVSGVDGDLAKLIERLKSRSPANRPTAVEACSRLAWIQGKPARRARRWLAVAVVLLIIVASGKYMQDLHYERRIADSNRAEAESLVEFMLGDLRERLEPVGRLDVLDEVGDRALAYFAARSADERTDADHHRFARAMNQIGEVRLNQGDLGAAREAFSQARLAAEALVDQDPGQGQWLLTLGAAEFWLGNVALTEGDQEQSERKFLAYLAVAKRLVALDSQDEEWQRELGYAHTNLAALRETQGQVASARTHLDESIRIKRFLLEVAPDDPGRRSNLINSLAWQGRVMLAEGDLRAAHANYSLAVDEARALVTADSNNMVYRELLSSLLHLHGRTSERFGQDKKAEELYRDSYRMSEELVLHDPSNTSWKFSLVVSHTGIGLHQFRSGKLDNAETHLKEAAALLGGLIQTESGNIDSHIQLAKVCLGLASVAYKKGNLVAARGHLSLALDEARGSREMTDDASVIEILANCLILLGEIENTEGRTAFAVAAWKEASDVFQPLVPNYRVDTARETLVRIHTHLGNTKEARRVSDDLHAEGFARQDFERFRIEHGL